MIESLTFSFYFKLLIILPLLLIISWIFRHSAKKEKIIKVSTNLIPLLLVLGLVFITFKYS